MISIAYIHLGCLILLIGGFFLHKQDQPSGTTTTITFLSLIVVVVTGILLALDTIGILPTISVDVS